MKCRSCDKDIEYGNLCVECSIEIETEISAFEEEDRASCALAQAAWDAGLDCRPASEPFDSVLIEGFNQEITDWNAWAKTEGVRLLRERLPN